METERLAIIDCLAHSYQVVVVIDSTLAKIDQMRLLQELQVELLDSRVVVVAKDFVTDCHSTPAWSQAVLPEYNNKTNLAAIVHDWLYMEWEQFVDPYPELLALQESQARAYADSVYLELMERFNQGRWPNKIYYAGVRLFGWWNWRKFRKRNKISLGMPRNSIEDDRSGRAGVRSALIRRLRTK